MKINNNAVLKAVEEAQHTRLLRAAEPVSLRRGRPLYEAGESMRYVWFPTSALVSFVFGIDDGAATEIAVVGRDSLIGLWEVMGGGKAPGRALVQQSGHAWRIDQALFRREFERQCALRATLQRHMLAFTVQAAYTAVCNRYHTIPQQLARALLMRLDRVPGNEIEMTQEMLAYVLGVRRTGVTEAAGKLQQQGLIAYRRGCIAVADRAGLERSACSCYAAIAAECARIVARDEP